MAMGLPSGLQVRAASGRLLIATLTAILCAAPAAFSADNDCGAEASAIVRQAYPAARATTEESFDLNGATITLPADGSLDYRSNTMVCRQWPARPDVLLVAVPLMGKSPEPGLEEGDLELIVMDFDTLAIRHRMVLEDAMFADAVRISDVAFDTALYQLSPDDLAFGLRISKTNGSRANPFEQAMLRLFSIQGGKLRLVLDKLAVSENWGEWDTNCSGEFRDTKRILSMAKPAKATLADIVISETTVTSLNKEVGTECESTEKTTTAKHRLRYANGSYAVPEALQGL
jgi:hypothetical protein